MSKYDGKTDEEANSEFRKTVAFMDELRAISPELADWAKNELNRGNTLQAVKKRIDEVVNLLTDMMGRVAVEEVTVE